MTKPIISLKNHLSYLLISAAIFAATSVLAEQAKPSPAPSDTAHLKYTCVMHPEIMRDQPGNCSKCGMKLVPVHSSRKTEPRAHSHGQSSPGHHDMAGMAMGHMAMASSIDLADPMSRESSGTSWVPDSTPMYGKMFMFGDDMLMVHGGIFPRYTNVSTRRG